jgi:hypothetical protein
MLGAFIYCSIGPEDAVLYGFSQHVLVPPTVRHFHFVRLVMATAGTAVLIRRAILGKALISY